MVTRNTHLSETPGSTSFSLVSIVQRLASRISRWKRARRLAQAAQVSTYPIDAASWRVFSLHGASFSRAHCSTSRWPPNAAPKHVFSFHGQPFARAHFSTLRWPPYAAFAHVSSSHGQPFSRAHCSTSRWP